MTWNKWLVTAGFVGLVSWAAFPDAAEARSSRRCCRQAMKCARPARHRCVQPAATCVAATTCPSACTGTSATTITPIQDGTHATHGQSYETAPPPPPVEPTKT